MINYFSMGEDARVGAGFEKNRTESRFCNKALYWIFGTWNLLCPCRRPSNIYE
jgi:diacylglycerol kinase (ATP)